LYIVTLFIVPSASLVPLLSIKQTLYQTEMCGIKQLGVNITNQALA